MTTLIEFLSADISVGFAFSIMMVAILIMAAITQVMKSKYEDIICDMAKVIDENQDIKESLFDTVDEAQVIIDKQQAKIKQLFDTVDEAQAIIDKQCYLSAIE